MFNGVLLCICVFILTVYRNQAEEERVVFIGKLDKFTRSQSKTIFQVTQFNSSNSYTVGAQYTKDGILKVSTSGIYFVACQLILSTTSLNIFTLAVNVNKENIRSSSLQAIFSQSKGTFRLQVSGVLRIEHSGIIQIFVISHTPADELTLKSNSRISLFLVSQKSFIQAISVQLTSYDKHHTVRYIDKTSSIPWESGSSSGSFISTNLFMTSSGYLVIEKDGNYVTTVNGIFLSHQHKACRHSVKVYGNNNILLLYTTKLTQVYQQNVTVSTTGLLHLQRNDRIWIKFRSSCKDSVISKYSTWTVSKLATLPGISLKCTEHDSYRFQVGWIQLDLSNFQYSHKGGFKNKEFKQDANSLKLEKKGIVLLSIMLKLKTQVNTTGLRLAISKNVIVNKDTVATSSDITFVDALGDLLEQTTIQIHKLIQVERNDLFRFYLLIPHDYRWLILKNSMLSMLYIQQIEDPSTETLVVDTVKKKWVLLPQCFDKDNSLVNSKNGTVRVFENGVYYAIINVDFHWPTQTTKELVDVEMKFQRSPQEKTLLYSSESSIRLQRSLKMNGILILSYEDEYQVYIRKSSSNPINASCTAQLQFLGHQSIITGFQAYLSKDIKTQNTGFTNMIHENSFIDDSDSEYFEEGIFTASAEGIYLVSANMIIKNIRMITEDDKVALQLIRNSTQKTLYYTQRQRKLNYINSDRNAIVTLTLAGTIELNKNDKLHLQVYINDKSVVFDKQSSFAIVFVEPTNQVHGLTYVRNIRSTASRTERWRIIDGWDLPSTTEFSLGTFKGTSPSSPQLTIDSNLVFKENGLYLITFHVLLNQQQNGKEFQVRFVKHSDSSYKKCDDFFNQFEVSATSCQFIHYFKKEDVYSFRIYNADGVDYEDFFPITHGINRGYVSVLSLKASRCYQFLATNLKRKQEFSSSREIIKPFITDSKVTFLGDVGYDTSTGIFTAHSSGWYMFTMMFLYFEKTFGNATIVINKSFGQKEIPLVKSAGDSNDNYPYLMLIGTAYLNAKDRISPMMAGYGSGYAHFTTSFTLSNLPSKGNRRNNVNKVTTKDRYELQKMDKVSSLFKSRILWNQINSSATDKIFLRRGVYLIVVNIIVLSAGTQVQCEVNINENDLRYSSRYITKIGQLFTFSLGGGLVVRNASDYLSVNIRGMSGTFVEAESTLSTVYLHEEVDQHPTIVLQVKDRIKIERLASNWLFIPSMLPVVLIKFLHQNNFIIPQVTGVYLISCSIIVGTTSKMIVELGIGLNHQLIGKTANKIQRRDTITYLKSVFIKQSSLVSVRLFTVRHGKFFIEAGSYFSMVMIESPQGEPLRSFAPAITSDLLEGNFIKPTIHRKLECNAVSGDYNIKYSWYFNNKLIPDETSDTLYVNLSLGNGYFQCQAIHDGVGPLSQPAVLYIQPINECLGHLTQHCKTPDAVCKDKLVGFSCQCRNTNYRYIHGECIATSRNTDGDSSSIPMVILILVPFILITLLIVIICSIYVCIKRKRSEEDPEREAFSVHNENHEDFITMRSLNTSMNDENEINEQTPRQSVGTTPRLSVADTVDNAMLVHHNEIVRRRDRRTYSTRSYTSTTFSGYDENTDTGAFTEHKWKKLMNASTKV